MRVKILDFGLARDVKEDTTLTQLGTIVGTPAYMAPEQAKGTPVDHRSDLFSLGCVLYRLSTGQLPFRGDNTLAILSSLATETPEAPDLLCPDMPTAASAFILKLLEKDPENRPASAQEAAETLQRLLREMRQAAKGTAASDTDLKPVTVAATFRPGKWWWIAGAASFVLVALSLSIAMWPRDEVKKDAKVDVVPKTTPKTAPEPALPGDDSLFGRLKQDAIPKDDLAWVFGTTKNMPRELVGLIRNHSAATAEDARLTGFALSADGRWLASGGPGFQVETHDLATRAWHLGTKSANAVGYAFALGKHALFSAGPASIVSRDLLTSEEFIPYSMPAGSANSAFAGTPEGNLFFMGTAEGKIHVLNPANWKRPEILSGHTVPIVVLLPSPDGKKLVSTDASGNVNLWNLIPGKGLAGIGGLKKNPEAKPFERVPERLPEAAFPKDRGKLRQIAFGPDGVHTLLVAFEGSQTIHGVNLDKKSALNPFPAGMDVAAFALTPDGKFLAAISPRGQLRLWQFEQVRQLKEVNLPPVGDEGYGPIHFTPDGRHLLIAIPRGAVAIVRIG